MRLEKTGEGPTGQQPNGAQSAAEYYTSLFEVRIAQTADDVRLSQALRYRVYCEETDFLPPEENPGGIERDELDDRSVAVLLVHRLTGDCVGTVRMIMPDLSQELGGLPARLCSPEMRALTDETMPVATTGEISRYTIAPEFRRRAGDTLYQQVYNTEEEQGDMRRVIPYMALGLFTGVLELVMQRGLTHVSAIIDPALLRMIRRLHMRFEPVGGLVDFHGRRQPVFAATKELYGGMKKLPPEHLKIVNKNGTLGL